MEEKYWSKFSQTYDKNQEYVVGNDLLKAIQNVLKVFKDGRL